VTQDSLPGRETTRRAALAGAGFAGLAATLAACGGGSSSSSGSVVSGPAPSPLPAQAIKVTGGKIKLA
jgi:Rieske Fe-S protein